MAHPEPISLEPRSGDTLGRYELLMPLARGGMAVVWAARLRGTRGFEKLVAIKTMLPGMSDDASFEKMFLDEAKLAARVQSPHVVEILDLGEERGVLYIVMEWVDGDPLNEIMRAASRVGPIPLGVAVSVVMQACAGIHAAHELKDEQGNRLELVHRDISPHNILVGFDGIAKVSDFGIAKAMAIGGSSTEVGEVKGKTAYMSPEQAIGAAIDRRSDVFALGVVLYQLSTGTHPFRGQTDGETIANIVLPDPPRRPTQFVPGYPPELEAVVMKALAKEVVQRHRSASALLDELNRALPPSAQSGMGYERIGGYVESLLGSRRVERRDLLKSALSASEERSTARAVDALPNVASSDATQRRRRRRSMPVAVSALATLGIGAIVLWARGGEPAPALRTDTAVADAPQAAGVAVPTPLAIVAPEEKSGPAQAAPPSLASAETDGEIPERTRAAPAVSRDSSRVAAAGPVPKVSRTRSETQSSSAAAKPAATPRSRTSPRLSPVRTPGF